MLFTRKKSKKVKRHNGKYNLLFMKWPQLFKVAAIFVFMA